MNKNISVFVFGNPVNFDGLTIKSFGFIREQKIDIGKYLDFDRSYMPHSIDSEVYRLVRFSYQGEMLTIFSSYRFINPNDVDYNRGNYIAFGFAFKGSVSQFSSTAILTTIAELHGYILRYMNVKKNSLKENLSINDIEIKITPLFSSIVSNTIKKDGSKNNRVIEYYSVMDNKTVLSDVITTFSFGIGKMENADIIIFPEKHNFKGRSFVDIKKISTANELTILTKKSNSLRLEIEKNKKYIEEKNSKNTDSYYIENTNNRLKSENNRLKNNIRILNLELKNRAEDELKNKKLNGVILGAISFFIIILIAVILTTVPNKKESTVFVKNEPENKSSIEKKSDYETYKPY